MRTSGSGEVAVIGAGWYGSHIALSLSRNGYTVTLFEKNADIFNEVSGRFGVRLHTGPHYPRSPATRRGCHQGFTEFCARYPQLVNHHEYSIYGLGIRDANDEPSKVTPEQFRQVCQEFQYRTEINLGRSRYQNILVAIDMEEPSIVVGVRLRETFKKLLSAARVNIVNNFTVIKIEKHAAKIAIVSRESTPLLFDHVINTTGYQSLLPMDRLPLQMEIVYQPCVALVYRDTTPSDRPFSFIVMDGWFPCLMPYDDRIDFSDTSSRKYIMTHGKWTIMGSYKTAAEANAHLAAVNDEFIERHARPSCEASMIKFWPEFSRRFQYMHWIGAVIAKIKSEREFRSAVTFQHQSSGIVFVLPGKVSNIFDAEREVLSLIRQQAILRHGQYQYIRGGVLADAIQEIIERPIILERNTCELQPYQTLYAQRRYGHIQNRNLAKGKLLNLIFLALSSILIVYGSAVQNNYNAFLIMAGIIGTCIGIVLLLSDMPHKKGVRSDEVQNNLINFKALYCVT